MASHGLGRVKAAAAGALGCAAASAASGCAPPSVLEAGTREFPRVVTAWACDDGSTPRTAFDPTQGATLRLESGPVERLLAPEPASLGRRWVDEGTSFWMRTPTDALLATPGRVTPCRRVS